MSPGPLPTLQEITDWLKREGIIEVPDHLKDNPLLSKEKVKKIRTRHLRKKQLRRNKK